MDRLRSHTDRVTIDIETFDWPFSERNVGEAVVEECFVKSKKKKAIDRQSQIPICNILHINRCNFSIYSI